MRTKQRNPAAHPDDIVQYVDVSAVSAEQLRVTRPTLYRGADAPGRARKEIRTGDTIFATIRPSLHRVAQVPAELDGELCSTAFCVIRAAPGVADQDFLYFLTSSDVFVERIAAHQKGSSYPAVTDRDVLAELIPLPPLPEQRAIAHVLSTIQRAREANEAVIAATIELKKSLMRHLFTYGRVPLHEIDRVALKGTVVGQIPEYWQTVQLGELAKIGNGSTPKKDKDVYWTRGTIPWLTSSKVHEVVIRHPDQYVSCTAQRECHLPLVPAGSLVVAITGQGKTLGRAALVAFNTTVSQHLAYLDFNQGPALPDFVLSYLRFHYEDLRQNGQMGGSTKGALTCAFLRRYQVPLPSLVEQHAIAEVSSRLDEKLGVEVRREASLRALLTTLQLDLVAGRLRAVL